MKISFINNVITKLKTLNGQSSRSLQAAQGYIGLARCCYISQTEPDKFFIIVDTSRDTLSDSEQMSDFTHKIRQYFTFNMEKSYVQVTDEGGRD